MDGDSAGGVGGATDTGAAGSGAGAPDTSGAPTGATDTTGIGASDDTGAMSNSNPNNPNAPAQGISFTSDDTGGESDTGPSGIAALAAKMGITAAAFASGIGAIAATALGAFAGGAIGHGISMGDGSPASVSDGAGTGDVAPIFSTGANNYRPYMARIAANETTRPFYVSANAPTTTPANQIRPQQTAMKSGVVSTSALPVGAVSAPVIRKPQAAYNSVALGANPPAKAADAPARASDAGGSNLIGGILATLGFVAFLHSFSVGG